MRIGGDEGGLRHLEVQENVRNPRDDRAMVESAQLREISRRAGSLLRPVSDSELQPAGQERRTVDRQGSQPELVLLLSVEQVARALGIGRSKTYELIAAGELETVHIGRSVRVPVDAVERFVDGLRRPASEL